MIILLYVIFCQFYGFLVTWGPADALHPGWLLNQDAVAVKWVAGTLAAVLFTSTIMHYYYDGFIWKIRHKENRQNLEMEGESSSAMESPESTGSWWDKETSGSPGKTLLRQAVYFLPPILFVMVSYFLANQDEASRDPINYARETIIAYEDDLDSFQDRIGPALQAQDGQMEVEEQMVKLRHGHADHLVRLAFMNTFYGQLVIRKEWRGAGQRSAIEDCHRRYQKSIELLEVAIRTPGSRSTRARCARCSLPGEGRCRYWSRNSDLAAATTTTQASPAAVAPDAFSSSRASRPSRSLVPIRTVFSPRMIFTQS